MNAYELLDCEKTSTQEEIKQSYHRLLLVYHPDKNTGENVQDNIEKFIKIKSAYNILSNPTERNAYDSLLKQIELQQKGTDLNEYEFLNDDGENMFLLSLKKDFVYNTELREYARGCRCGSVYKIKDKYLNESLFSQLNELIDNLSTDKFIVALECDTCSIVINVLVI